MSNTMGNQWRRKGWDAPSAPPPPTYPFFFAGGLEWTMRDIEIVFFLYRCQEKVKNIPSYEVISYKTTPPPLLKVLF